MLIKINFHFPLHAVPLVPIFSPLSISEILYWSIYIPLKSHPQDKYPHFSLLPWYPIFLFQPKLLTTSTRKWNSVAPIFIKHVNPRSGKGATKKSRDSSQSDVSGTQRQGTCAFDDPAVVTGIFDIVTILWVLHDNQLLKPDNKEARLKLLDTYIQFAQCFINYYKVKFGICKIRFERGCFCSR